MKATELRIGNIINYQFGTTVKQGNVRVITSRKVVVLSDSIKLQNVIPIPLTEEWLLKFGFEWIDEAFLYADERHCISERIGSFTFEPFCTTDSDCWISINHVHQLQNLYFALTGEELEAKP